MPQLWVNNLDADDFFNDRSIINDPNYGLYHRWNNGECADVDVRALRESIEAALIEQYGSASAL